MKRIIALCLFTTLLILISCSGNKNNIAGKWKVVHMYTTKDGVEDKELSNILSTVYVGRLYEFKDDGTGTLTDAPPFDGSAPKTISLKWNDGRKESDPIFNQLAKDRFTIVIRANSLSDGTTEVTEMWTAKHDAKSILFSEDRILTQISPATSNGSITLMLDRVK